MEALKENFIDKLAPEKEQANILDFKENLRLQIEETVDWEEIYERLKNTKQENVIVQKIVTEHEMDFIKSINQMKRLFRSELDHVLSGLEIEYQKELFRVKCAFNNFVFGENLMNLIKKLSENKYCLLMKDNKIWAHKFYHPSFQVRTAIKEDNTIIEYDDVICNLKGIYVNLLHSKITVTTIYINTDKQHPNAQGSGLTTVCPGNLEDREIDLTDPDKLVTLLNEICEVYQTIHLASSYITPDTEYEEIDERSEPWESR